MYRSAKAATDIVAERFKEDIRRFRYKFTPKPVAEIQQSKATISALKERIATLEHDLELERQGLLKRGLRRLRQLKR
jgi:polyhydroxyalkanoate synthesis regulator phasin